MKNFEYKNLTSSELSITGGESGAYYLGRALASMNQALDEVDEWFEGVLDSL